MANWIIAPIYQRMASLAAFRFDNSFARELGGFYTLWTPVAAPAPRLLYINGSLADQLGMDVALYDDPGGHLWELRAS